MMSEDKKCAADNTKIAGTKKISDWKKLREKLLPITEFNEDAWKEAFDQYFMQRLETRYFKPIRAISALEHDNGEGFSIVALYCSLIEFLRATQEGKQFIYGEKESQTVYSKSKEMFIRFLEKNEPFKSYTSQKNSAKNFYKYVRCGLLHEARTKGNWRILLSRKHLDRYKNKSIDCDAKIVFRDRLEQDFYQFLSDYRMTLIDKDKKNNKTRIAFIRKMNMLCDLPAKDPIDTHSES
ncbi:hypothetical protein [Thalassospira profundimaris]|uniref:hypothetical protein n=1 Tax=Thalassospira profundimaris TaxID=502049 RepID=UPI0011BF1DF3|nr:hypothetical protein [Thalassospira profundimaris]